MRSLIFLYALVGVIVGAFLNFLLIGNSARAGDFLTGALFGLAFGIALALGKYNIWDRK